MQASQDHTVEQIHMFTDGAGSQLKNRFVLSQVTKQSLIHKVIKLLDWSFFATCLRKRSGEQGRRHSIRTFWRRILQEKAHIKPAEEFGKCAQEACPNVCVVCKVKGSCRCPRGTRGVVWQQWATVPQRIPSTHELHFVKARGTSSVDVSEKSLFTVVPATPDFFDRPKSYRTVTVFESDTDRVVTTTESSHNSTILPMIIAKQYYVVDYLNCFYIGRILKAGNKTGF